MAMSRKGDVRENTLAQMHVCRRLINQHRAGFTLLEVMVAVAIMAFVLVTLIGLSNRSTQHVLLAERMTTATLLAKKVMTEMLLERPYKPLEEEGVFEEDEFKDYAWKKMITISEPMPGVMVTEIRAAVLWQEGERQEMVELVTYE